MFQLVNFLRSTANILRPPTWAVTAAVLYAGCALTPHGLEDERAALEENGAPYAVPFKERTLPELPAEPTWRDVLQRAFLANGELEAAYYEWQAALERVGIASAYPNTNITLGYSYAFSSENMKSFDRMTFSGGFDSMENLAFPSKVAKAGEIALSQARAAGERFHAKKFDLQQKVLSAWADYTLLSETLRIQGEQTELSKFVVETADARLRTGGSQPDVIRADIALTAAEDKTKTLEAEAAAARASLNAMLSRPANSPLQSPARIEAREIAVDDATLLAVAVDRNPELAALAHEVQGRSDALDLARLQWIPDINPSVVFTGDVTQVIGAAIVLPTTIDKIRGGINESRSMLRSSEAMLRQAAQDRASSFVGAMIMLRNAERQAALFQEQIIPASENILKTTQTAYSNGSATYLELIDTQRALLEARQTLAEAQTMREKKLAELEAIAGTDIETIIKESHARR